MPRTLILALLLSLSGASVMAQDSLFGGNPNALGLPLQNLFGGRVEEETAPLPRPRPNPYEWKPEWGPIWERGDEWPPEMEAWFKEQRRIDERDPEERRLTKELAEKKRQEFEAFKKRYEGWMREAQEALRPGVDI